ncbi:type II toxin-antitoxin system Phd/YefM family antitoxin [Treponema primitia]|uniref:type II toxin-antitoxin system Phd/YefM family antitoxin n=1 Tax=Treponema primitia TaxID=88058 RepID=UPI00025552E9|nr:type II toxin-antitoxin system Phd/YefM family antitoxin [Treponema primitia]
MINLVKDIRPISYVKAHTADVFKQLKEKNSPVVITQNGEAQAVLMNVNHYQNIMDALNLLKILSIGENDIKNGRTFTEEEMDKKIEKILG